MTPDLKDACVREGIEPGGTLWVLIERLERMLDEKVERLQGGLSQRGEKELIERVVLAVGGAVTVGLRRLNLGLAAGTGAVGLLLGLALGLALR